MPSPDVSVVIPTFRRETRLAFALEALAGQTLERSRFEVIVVRAPGAVGPFAQAPEGLEVRFLTAPGRGAAAQRNFGWRSAGGSLVAFTDDDCRPAPPWLERLLAASDGSSLIVQGRTEPDPAERHLLHGRARSVEITEPHEWFPTCNIAYPRALLERLEGFDEGYRHAWGEDSDLGLRALEEGARRVYVDEALAWHAVHARTLAGAIREATQRDAIPMVVSRHPGQRRHLYRGIFTRRSHMNLLIALAGLLLWRRSRPLALAAAYPYLRQNVAPERRRVDQLPRLLPRIAYHLLPRLIVDLVDLVATARAAIRHRTLVL